MRHLSSYFLVFTTLFCISVLGIDKKYVPQAQDTPSQKKAKIEAFVEDSIQYIHQVGMEKALPDFQERTGRFANLSEGGHQYIEVMKLDGTVLAHPSSYARGKNYWDWEHPTGSFPTQEAALIAQEGGGWHEITLPHPLTKKDAIRYEYIRPYQNHIILSGFYEDS